MKQAKSGQSYFDAKLQLGENILAKLVGFSSAKRNILKEFQHNKTPVLIDNIREEIDSTGKSCFMLSDSMHIKGTTVDFSPQSEAHKHIIIKNIDKDYIHGDDSYAITACVIKKIPANQNNFS